MRFPPQRGTAKGPTGSDPEGREPRTAVGAAIGPRRDDHVHVGALIRAPPSFPKPVFKPFGVKGTMIAPHRAPRVRRDPCVQAVSGWAWGAAFGRGDGVFWL
jgi:hypothetical protein